MNTQNRLSRAPASRHFRRASLALLAVIGGALLPLSLQAQSTYYWDGNSTAPGAGTTAQNGGTWNASTTLWSTVADGTGATGTATITSADTVIFTANDGIAGNNPTGGYTVTLGTAQSAYGIVLGNSSLPSGGGTLTLTGTGAPGLTIGAGGVTMNGANGDPTFHANLGTILLAADQTWTINNAKAWTVNSAVAGNATFGNTRAWTLGYIGAYTSTYTGLISDGSAGGKLALTLNNTNGITTGGGTTSITGLANTYTGQTTIQRGILQARSIANAGQASSLGAATGTDSIIDIGSGTNSGSLHFNNSTAASASDRVINLAGTTGGATIKNNNSNVAYSVTLGGATNAGSGDKTLTLSGTHTGDNTIGLIADAADLSKTSVTKTETGKWILSGANTYTGGTTISAGTLAVAATGTLGANASGNNILIAGGNLLLSASTNVGANQTISVTSAGGGIGVSYDPNDFPSITDNSGTTGGVFGINYSGTGGIGSVAGINALFTSSSRWFLGSFVGGSGTFTGASLTAGQGDNYRLGGGGGALTIQNNILVGANNLVVGSTGGGSVTLSNANTYAGTTTVQNGTLNASSLNRVVSGSASSSLGAPITEANGTISLGSGSNVVTLNYTGTGESTDRILRFAGTTGNVTLSNNGSGEIHYESAAIFSGNGNKTLFLGATTDTRGGSIGGIANSTGTTSVTKDGLTNSTWTLTGGAANTYSGNTTIRGGVLQTTAATDLANSYVSLSGASGTQYAVWQTQGSITRTLSGTASSSNLNLASNSGFAAKSGNLNVTLNGGASLTWGSGNFMGTGAAPLVFGSATADREVLFTNNINLNTTDAFSRVIHVEKGLGGDRARLTGILSPGTGPTGLTKTGAGTLALDGANTYTGTTLVSAGTLLINGDQTAATGNTTVSSGSTLGGAGIIGGATSIASGAFLTPGSTETGRGQLTFKNGLALNGTATLQIASADTRGVTYDAIDFASGTFTGTGALVLDFSALLSGGDSLNLFGGANFSSLINFSSVSATGVYSGVFDFDNGVYSLVKGAQTIYLTASSGDLSVVGSSIPEPASWAFLAGAAALAGSAIRRRRREA